MKAIITRSAAVLFFLLGIAVPGTAQTNRYQVYFVAVGSGWYAQASSKDVHAFTVIDGANKSAAIVADGLVSGGAVYGVKLTSDDGSYVTVGDIEKAIGMVATKIALQKPPQPLLVFYIASHGMSEGMAWSHFSIPGDFGYRGDPNDLDIEKLSSSTLYAGSLVDELEKLHTPFLVLLDSCYDGEEKHFEPTVLSSQATRNLNDVGAVLRAMNEFRDTYPVLFSATPGKAVRTVTNPLAPDSIVDIGPLARRFSLSTKERLAQGQTISLATLIEELTSPQLDSLTAPAVTHSKMPSGAGAPMLVPTATPHKVDSIVGSGSHINVCCESKVGGSNSAGHTPRRFTGALSLAGDPGEFVSSGKSWTLRSPTGRIQLTQNGPGEIEISFEDGKTGFDVSFSSDTGKRFELKTYAAAERFGFASDGRPGMELSGDGRGCNGLVGSFTVTKVSYKPDGTITGFAATFSQRCEDSNLMARGSVSVTVQ